MNENNDKENVDVEKTYNVKFNKSLISVLIVIIVVLLATIGVTLGLLFSGDRSQNGGNNIENAAENKVGNQIGNVVENNNTNNKVVNVKYEKVYLDNTGKIYFLVRGYNSENKTVWEYKTEEGYDAQYEIFLEMGIYNQKAYLFEQGMIVCLDEQSGNKLWSFNLSKNSGYANAGCVIGFAYKFDKNGTLYVTARNSKYNLCILNTDGKILKTYENKELDSIKYLAINGSPTMKLDETSKILKIECDSYDVYKESPTAVEINLKDYSYKVYYNEQNNYAAEYIKIIEKFEKENSKDDIACDLIYFNNDNIPDLIVICSGEANIYMYENNTVHNAVIENWVTDIGGSKYYEYQEKNGSIYNYGNGYAGAISYDTFYILNSKYEFDKYLHISEGADIEETDSNL